MANPFVHIELQTKDLQRAKTFYQDLFDWSYDELPAPGPAGTYTMINTGSQPGGGMFTNPEPKVPPHWLVYVGVDDIRAKTDQARELGATIAQDVLEVGEHGWLSVIIDPTGAALGLWQGKEGHP